jgi:hypothetical protein
MVVSRTSGHKTSGNFPFVQKIYIIIIVIKCYDYKIIIGDQKTRRYDDFTMLKTTRAP